MKKFFEVKLICPFCEKEINYNIISFKAKYECEHCENELIVRSKPMVSSIISIVGFLILFGFMEISGISKLTTIFRLAFIIIGCFVYLALANKLVSKLFGAEKIYAVDAQDPTLLKRYKNKKK